MSFRMLALSFLILSLIGCSTVRVEPLGNVALPTVRTTGGIPTVFKSRAEVTQPAIEVAVLTLNGQGYGLSEIASKFQVKAAQIGADGIILQEKNPEAENERDRFLDGSRATAVAISFRRPR